MKFNRCPLRLITQQSADYLEAYSFFNSGYLPNEGGWMGQSVKFIKAMRIIQSEVIRVQENRMKK